jgi:hypothetical protein
MKEDKYLQAATNLVKAIDIAIESLHKHPPKVWDDKTINHFMNFYTECKDRVINPEPQFRNLKSFKYVYEDVFTLFQESAGEDVNYFWDKIKEQGLPYKRENKLGKILKRKKIKDDIEYDFVIDVLVPYQQEGLINEEEVALLNIYIGDFEQRRKKSV